MICRMDDLPFRDAARGARHADVAAMLERQMSIALDDPAQALELLDAVTFEEHEPGVDREQLNEWISDQRAWLIGRTKDGSIESAADRFSTALDDLKRAVETAAQRSERRSSAAAQDATERCAALVENAERKLAKKLAKGTRAMRKEAIQIRAEALKNAERILELAGAQAARLLLDAHDRQHEADEAVAAAHALQEQLLNSIEAAHADMSAAPLSDAA